MKKFSIILAALGMILVGCNKNDNKWTPGPEAPKDAKAICFPETSNLDMECDPANPYTEWTIAVVRNDETGVYAATEMKIFVKENTDNVYEVPAACTFAEGEKETTIDVKIGQMDAGVTYALTISVNTDETNPYKEIEDGAGYYYQMSICPIAWSEIMQGVIVDGWINDWFSTGLIPFYTDYQIAELPGNKTRIRLINPYARASETGMPDENGIYDAFPELAEDELLPDGPYNFIIDIDPDGNAELHQGQVGFDWGYGNMIVVSSGDALGTWDGAQLLFGADEGTIVTCLPNYSESFYYCGSDWTFYASVEAYNEYNPSAKYEDYLGEWTATTDEGTWNWTIEPGMESDFVINGVEGMTNGIQAWFTENNTLYIEAQQETAEEGRVNNLYFIKQDGLQDQFGGIEFYYNLEKETISIDAEAENIGMNIYNESETNPEADYTLLSSYNLKKVTFAKVPAQSAPKRGNAKKMLKKH